MKVYSEDNGYQCLGVSRVWVVENFLKHRDDIIIRNLIAPEIEEAIINDRLSSSFYQEDIEDLIEARKIYQEALRIFESTRLQILHAKPKLNPKLSAELSPEFSSNLKSMYEKQSCDIVFDEPFKEQVKQFSPEEQLHLKKLQEKVVQARVALRHCCRSTKVFKAYVTKVIANPNVKLICFGAINGQGARTSSLDAIAKIKDLNVQVWSRSESSKPWQVFKISRNNPSPYMLPILYQDGHFKTVIASANVSSSSNSASSSSSSSSSPNSNPSGSSSSFSFGPNSNSSSSSSSSSFSAGSNLDLPLELIKMAEEFERHSHQQDSGQQGSGQNYQHNNEKNGQGKDRFENKQNFEKSQAEKERSEKIKKAKIHHEIEQGIAKTYFNSNSGKLYSDILSVYQNIAAGQNITEALNQYNVDINATNDIGHSILHFATQARNLPVMRTLIQQGAVCDVDVDKLENIIKNLQAEDISLPLKEQTLDELYLWRYLWDEEKKLYLQIKMLTEKPVMTPLQIAIQNGDEAAALLLLENGASVKHKNIGKYARMSPLYRTCLHDRKNLIPILLQYGASMAEPSPEGTVLEYVVANDKVSLIQQFYQCGADIDSLITNNATILKLRQEIQQIKAETAGSRIHQASFLAAHRAGFQVKFSTEIMAEKRILFDTHCHSKDMYTLTITQRDPILKKKITLSRAINLNELNKPLMVSLDHLKCSLQFDKQGILAI